MDVALDVLPSTAVRLILPALSGWHATVIGDVPSYLIPAPPARTEVVIHVGPLVVCPEDLESWRAANERADAPGPVVEAVAPEAPFPTDDGWPAVFWRVRFRSAAGEPVEERLVAVFRCLHTLAAVLVRGRSAEALDARLPEIVAVLARARPDFRSDEPAALAELWDLDGS